MIFGRTPYTIKMERQAMLFKHYNMKNANLRKKFSLAQFLGD